MKAVGWIGLVMVSFWLQASFFGALRPFGVIPNLVLIILIIAAPICTASQTIGYGVACGFFLDLASGADFGLRTAFYSLLAITLALLKRSGADFERASMALTALAGGTLLYNAAVIGSLVPAGGGIIWSVVIGRLITEFVINAVIYLASDWLLSQLLATLSLPVRGR